MVCGALINGTAPAVTPAEQNASSRDIVAHMRPFPAAAQDALAALSTLGTAGRAAFAPGAAQALMTFIHNACGEDSGWVLPARNGAQGAAYVMKIKCPLQQYIAFNFHPDIPDYAVFPASLRYSTCLDPAEMRRVYARIRLGPTGAQECVTGRIDGTEEITPNPESGSYFCYTNSRTFLRGKLAGRDALFSCTEMTAPSALSRRGIPVGSYEQALFYYSDKPGLNLSGMTWMLSRITRSTTLSVYVALSSNETAVASFAWLKAGWKGLNLVRAPHILKSQKATLDYSRRIAQHPGVSAESIAAIVASVRSLSGATVDADYERYLAYVRSWRDDGKKSFFTQRALLQELYDAGAAQVIPAPYRRALLVQERVRTLLGTPTWSAPPAIAQHGLAAR